MRPELKATTTFNNTHEKQKNSIRKMSELKVAEKWDSALEKGIKRTAYGAIAGGVVAALLFRKFLRVFFYFFFKSNKQ